MTEWDDEGSIPNEVEAAAVNEWLFNIDTVDKVLEHLMSKGLKIEGGDQIGKSIIFAKNHKHAHFIQERFDTNYPHLKGHFARVIDNKESYAQNLIDKFSSTKSIKDAPRLVISVDMMDTGIDVPDLLNLVFFKIVRSKTKFWQMIGRGTLPMLEVIRLRLRDLIRHIEKRKRKIVITDFEDEIGESVEVKLKGLGAAVDKAQYQKKFLAFIDEHADQLAFQKVKLNEPLTKVDLQELERILFESGDLGNRKLFEECYGETENLGLFLRKLVGLDRNAAKSAFDEFLDETSFNAKQIAFINHIIDYLTQNGVMEPKLLFEHPFTNIAPNGPMSVFKEDQASKIIQIIKGFNRNAGAATG